MNDDGVMTPEQIVAFEEAMALQLKLGEALEPFIREPAGPGWELYTLSFWARRSAPNVVRLDAFNLTKGDRTGWVPPLSVSGEPFDIPGPLGEGAGMSKMTRRERKRVRDGAMAYARMYLGVRRLPAGVPTLVRDYVDGLEALPPSPDQTIASMLRPYRRRPWVL